jgi:exopolyphosphatase/guanosine-5'-triphosphate,3'-diphosphate pyrophosphatase
MLKYAGVDVGSNTIRLLIAEVKDNRIIDVFSDRRTTRLGNSVDRTGLLQDENMKASIDVLREFSSLFSKFGVRYSRAVATSALREASNSDTFVKEVLNAAGISIEVIPGEKEAELTLKGILSSLPDLGFRVSHAALIIDIGGGSSEWVLYRDQNNVDMGSIPIGVIKLVQKWIKTDPVSESDIRALNNEFIPALHDLKAGIGHFVNNNTCFIGTGGTFTTIASLDLGLEAYSREKIHLHRIPINRLQDIYKSLLVLPLEERKKVKGLEPGRADLIIPGILFTINMMKYFDLNELRISDYGILEGVIFEIRETIEKNISETGKP